MAEWKIKVVGLTYEDPESLLAHPKNPKIHPASQSAILRAAIERVGVIGVAIQNDVTGYLIDGHERVGEAIATHQPTFPVLHVELSEEDEDFALATFDPIGYLAVKDQALTDELLDGVIADSPALNDFLESLRTREPFDPTAEWQGMPEFEQQDKNAFRSLIVHFDSFDDLKDFAALVKQPVTEKTKFIWFPIKERETLKDIAFDGEHES